MKTVLILAAGESKRWAGRLKQLAKLWDGETVLTRIVRQIYTAGLQARLVTRDDRLVHAVAPWALPFFPQMAGSIYETLLSTRALWTEQTVALLGDVVFTDEAMAEILQPAVGLRIFTNPRETYALAFDEQVHGQLEAELRSQAARVAAGGLGSLRAMRDTIAPSAWVLIDDWTDDVDTVEKYELVLACWDKLESGAVISPVRTINFSITNRCSRKCPSCISGLQRNHRERRDQTLEEIEIAAAMLGPVEIISLYGGEPSLHARFPQLAAWAHKIFQAEQITIQTNGYGFTRAPEAFLNFDYIIASVYTSRTYPGCPSNIAEVEAFRRFLRVRGQEGKLKAGEVIHTADHGVYGGAPCYRQEMPTISYFDGRLYPCCTGEGIPGAIGIPLTVAWRQEIPKVAMPCGTCLLSIGAPA